MIIKGEFQDCINELASRLYYEIKIHKGIFLISGASGLIGSTIITSLLYMNDLYSCHFKVIAIARTIGRAEEMLGDFFGREDFQFVLCDVNESLPEVGRIDYIIHAASNTHPLEYSGDPVGTIRTNVIGTINLLEYARLHGLKRFTFLSSVEIYGENKDVGKFSESDGGYIDCNRVRSGYPESKRVGESLCCAYKSEFGIDFVIPRLCRVYGPTMKKDDSKAIAQFIKKASAGENIILKSEGQQYYSYIHVIDAVKAIFYILDKGNSGEVYNVSSEKSNIKLIDLANKIARISNVKVIFEMPKEDEKKGYSFATRAILDNTKLKNLGWEEIYDIDSGLKMTMHMLRKSREILS